MCHHYGVNHVSPRLHVYGFTVFAHGHQCRCGSACASSITPTAARSEPDTALRALLLAYTLELRHARLRASRANIYVGRAAGSNLPHGRRKIRSDCGWAPTAVSVRGDREVSGRCVYEGVCEAPTFTEWSTMMVPTYPEDDSRALKVYQHQHHGCTGQGQKRRLSSVRDRRNTICYLETASADSAVPLPTRSSRKG